MPTRVLVWGIHLLPDLNHLGGKFVPLIGLSDEDMDTMITTYNTAVTDAASEIVGKERRRKKPWFSTSVMRGEI